MRQVLPNFSKGEIAPRLYARIDAGQYSAALKRAENVIVQRYGGVDSRPGFEVIGELDEFDKDVRLMPFQFSTDQAYVIAAQQAYARPLALGGFVLVDDDMKIEGVTLGPTTTLEISYHGMEVGQRVYITGVEGTTELNGQLATVIGVPDADHVTVDIDSSGYAAYTDSSGAVRTEAPSPPPEPPPPPPPTPEPTPPPIVGGGKIPWWKLPPPEMG